MTPFETYCKVVVSNDLLGLSRFMKYQHTLNIRYLQHVQSRKHLYIFLTTLFLVSAAAGAEDACMPSDRADEYEDRFGRSPLAASVSQLRELYQNPTVIEARVSRTTEDGASIETLTETHVVLPVAAGDFMGILKDEEAMRDAIPNLRDHEIICHLSPTRYRQRQKTEFPVLLFNLGTEYVLDLEFTSLGPDVYSSRWILVESIDGRMAYIYGSWFLEAIELDGQTVTYVRHYARTGLTTRVPGVRGFIQRRVEGEVVSLIDSVYQAAVGRSGGVGKQ